MTTTSRPHNVRPFLKMHGLGNDFVIFDGRQTPLDLSVAQARAVADRKRGVGCDQIITLQPSSVGQIFMRIQNADGSEVDACGNATRCVARLIMVEMGTDNTTIETGAGLLRAARQDNLITVDMGIPKLGWSDIPLARENDTLHVDFQCAMLSDPVAVNVGNPHVVFFVDNIATIPLEDLGPQIEHDALFPERVNVSIAEVKSRDNIILRVWERGAGITEACGTAACATIVAASLRGLVDRVATVNLAGGVLNMSWDDHDHIHMTGPATPTFMGEVFLREGP